MCTLIICRDAFRFYPLVVAANRDEELARPASPPRTWDGEPRILAPVDEQAGGTWIGVSENGVLAAVTNRGIPHDPEKIMSRGELIPIALQGRDAGEALENICRLDGSLFNGFHLTLADKDVSYLACGDGGSVIHDSRLPTGFQVITNEGTGIDHSLRAVRIRQLFERDVSRHPPTRAGLGQLLDIHDDGPPYPAHNPQSASCIHPFGRSYGTRSSGVIRLNEIDGEPLWEWWHREKPEGSPNCMGEWSRLAPFRIKK